MGLDACGRPTELPDNYNVGADGAPGETHDFLSLLSNIPGGMWDAAKSTARGVGSAADHAWAFAKLDDEEQGQRLGKAVDGGVATVREAAAQAWNHPGETLKAGADRAKASIDGLGNACPSDAGHAVGGLMLNYATGKVVASTVGKVAGLAGDMASDGVKPATAALDATKDVAPEPPVMKAEAPAETTPPSSAISVDPTLGGRGNSVGSPVRTSDSEPRNVRISAPAGPEGNPRMIFTGRADLDVGQQRLLDQLPGNGSTVEVPNAAVKETDISALTAKTGDEFAQFQQGERVLLVRGDHTSVPVGTEQAAGLARDGWKWTAHTQPGDALSHCRPSDSDRAILAAMGQKESTIYNSVGDSLEFTPQGVSLRNWKP